MAKEQLQKVDIKTWFLELCTLHHLCNGQKLFSNTKARSVDFVTVGGHVIQTEEISTVLI